MRFRWVCRLGLAAVPGFFAAWSVAQAGEPHPLFVALNQKLAAIGAEYRADLSSTVSGAAGAGAIRRTSATRGSVWSSAFPRIGSGDTNDRFAALLRWRLAGWRARAETGISVMTQNQYLGADLAPLLGARDETASNAALVAALRRIADNEFPRRAERLARLIAQRRPHLVGLQEVWSLQCIDLAVPPPGFGCGDPSIAGAFNDHLSETLSALTARGAIYHAVATVENLDVRDIQAPGLPPGMPFEINGVPALLVALDRDVILARSDVVAAGPVTPVTFPCVRPSANGCNFQAFPRVETPAGPLAIERGFVAVDATVNDRNYRFVNTHLEIRNPDPTDPLSSFFQAAQAAELIETLELTTPADRSLIMVGDINSSPESLGVPGPLPLPEPFDEGIVTPYTQLVYSGYVDAWTLGRPPPDGSTCCQLPDLSNMASLLDRRIDMIFARDMPVAVRGVAVVGDRVFDQTPPPGPALWPSDHGSVTARILF